MLVFLVEMNGLQTWSTDISNAYLEAEIKEKIFFVTGPEFSELARHTQIVDVLEWKYKFKMKGMGPISFHLSMVSSVMIKESFVSAPSATSNG
jgi:hypothetical protein